ncbi:hypothetical protein [Geodermatophilus sp. URMC 64]
MRDYWEIHQQSLRHRQALDLFREVFVGAQSSATPFTHSPGRPKFKDTLHNFHPDNWAAACALGSPLGYPHSVDYVTREHGTVSLEGNVALFGGCTSTDETTIAFEFEGPNDRTLRRPVKPLIPLRWCELGDVNDPAVADTGPVAYNYEGVGPRRTAAWPVVELDMQSGKATHYYIPRLSRESVDVQEQSLPLPSDNYLYITRLPNFLDENFDPDRRDNWRHMLLFSGSNGIGTRAAELLITSGGLDQLEEASRSLGGSREFQILLRAHQPVEENGGYHRFTRLEFIGAQPLDNLVSIENYRSAYERAQQRLKSPRPVWVVDR